MYSGIKCKKCRSVVFSEDQCKLLFLNAHNLNLDTSNESDCTVDNVMFLNGDLLPAWIMQRIEAEEWSKGRINCQKCDSRIGAFNFISGQKCDCTNFVLPPIHLIKSKIDLIK